MYLKPYLILIIFYLYSFGCIAQEMSVTHHIEAIEEHSQFHFNFDKALTDMELVESSLLVGFSRDSIVAFFDYTSFEVEFIDNTIVVFPRKPKVYVICGEVRGRLEGSPLPFASVYLNSVEATEANEIGVFELEVNALSNERFNISYLGFESVSIRVADLLSCPVIELDQKSNYFGHPVIITSYIQRGITEGISYSNLQLDFGNNPNEITTYNQDILRTIQNIPGLATTDDSASKINIRGNTVDQNLLRWEGVTLYDQGHMFGMISSINPFNVDKIEIYKSSHSARFENKVGGIIDIKLSDVTPQKLQTNLGLNFSDANAHIHLPIIDEKVSLMVSGRKSIYGLWKKSPLYASYSKKLFNSQSIDVDESIIESSENDDPIYDYHDVNTKLIVDLNDKLKIRSSLMISSNSNENISVFDSVNILGGDLYNSNNIAISNRLSYEFSNSESLSLSQTYSKFDQKHESDVSILDSLNSIFRSEQDNVIDDFQLNVSYHKSFSKMDASIGYVFDRKKTSTVTELESNLGQEISTETNETGLFHHLFTQFSRKNKRSYLELGLRSSYVHALRKIYVSPSFSGRYTLGMGLTAKIGGGYFNQFIKQEYKTVNQNLHIENSIWTLGLDSENPVLVAGKLSAGAIYRKSGWLLDIEGYWHKTKGMAAQNPSIRNPVSTLINNEILSRGIDVLINKKIKDWRSSLFYTFSNNQIKLPVLEGNEMENETFYANNNQTHNFKILNSYSIGKITISLSYHIKSGLPYSNLSITENEESEFEADYESYNNSNLKTYNRADLSFSYDTTWKNTRIQAGVNVLNVLDNLNEGTRKFYISEYDKTNPNLDVIEISKALLSRTINFHLKIAL